MPVPESSSSSNLQVLSQHPRHLHILPASP
nr:MAG TPA: hypothetical protein [Caudoviricetes sp.]